MRDRSRPVAREKSPCPRRKPAHGRFKAHNIGLRAQPSRPPAVHVASRPSAFARASAARARWSRRARERENASTSARAGGEKKSTKERLVSQRAVAVVGAIVEQTRRRREGGDRDGGGRGRARGATRRAGSGEGSRRGRSRRFPCRRTSARRPRACRRSIARYLLYYLMALRQGQVARAPRPRTSRVPVV